MMNSNVIIIFPNGIEKNVSGPISAHDITELAHPELGCNDVYFMFEGKKLFDESTVNHGKVFVVPRLRGGKGGFGSMLRAIGAQIEKTTNREACRDLSGRRLRDINEEKRLKSWITQQADREREAAERKMKRIERLVAEPKLEFKDPEYETARSEMTEKVADAVEQGFKAAACSSGTQVGTKRSSTSTSAAPKKKKACLWMGSDEEDLSSSVDTDDSEDEKVSSSPVETTKKISNTTSPDKQSSQEIASASSKE